MPPDASPGPAHSPLGGSNAKQWLSCPGSVKLSSGLDRHRSSYAAARGSALHAVVAECIDAGIGSVESIKPAVWKHEGHEGTISETDVEAIDAMLAYIASRIPSQEWWSGEYRVSLRGYLGDNSPVNPFGTVDFGMHDGSLLEIVDFKAGSGVIVSPVENDQCLFYAAGTFAALTQEVRDRIEHIRCTIVQPHGIGAPVQSWELPVIDLLIWIGDVLVPGIEATTEPDAALNPGEWCRFCPAAARCPRLAADAMRMAQIEFDDAYTNLTQDALVMAQEMDTHIATSLDIAERAQLWIDRVRQLAEEQLKAGQSIPGWHLVPTRPTRRWLHDDTETADSLMALGVKSGILWENRLRSPAQLEKALSRAIGGKTLWSRAAGLIESKSSGVKLARIITAEEEFDDEPTT